MDFGKNVRYRGSLVGTFITDEIITFRSKSMVFFYLLLVRKAVVSENDFVKKTRMHRDTFVIRLINNSLNVMSLLISIRRNILTRQDENFAIRFIAMYRR